MAKLKSKKFSADFNAQQSLKSKNLRISWDNGPKLKVGLLEFFLLQEKMWLLNQNGKWFTICRTVPFLTHWLLMENYMFKTALTYKFWELKEFISQILESLRLEIMMQFIPKNSKSYYMGNNKMSKQLLPHLLSRPINP